MSYICVKPGSNWRIYPASVRGNFVGGHRVKLMEQIGFHHALSINDEENSAYKYFSYQDVKKPDFMDRFKKNIHF